MAEDYSKEYLSAGTNGIPIPITGTTSAAATTIHQAGTATNVKDEVTVSFYNPGTAASIVYVQKCGTGANFQNVLTVPAQQNAVVAVPAWPIGGGLKIEAFSTSAVKPIADGFVNRITTS